MLTPVILHTVTEPSDPSDLPVPLVAKPFRRSPILKLNSANFVVQRNKRSLIHNWNKKNAGCTNV